MPYAIPAAIGTALLWALAASSAAQAPPPPGPPPPGPPSAIPDVQTASGCVPPGLFRAVFREISPGLTAADRRAQPRTLYRQGVAMLRSEELPDPMRGDQTVVAIAEPNIWAWSLTSRTGRHSVDPGPELEVRAPILPPVADLPPLFRALEFGCEAAFVGTYARAEQRVVPWGASQAGLHGVTIGEQTVVILMDKRRDAPLLISYLRQGKPVFVIRYDDYRVGLKDRPDLFMPPNNVKMDEAPMAPPRPQAAPSKDPPSPAKSLN